MKLPPWLARKLLQATCDKTALDRKILKLHHCFREADCFLEKICGKPASGKHKPERKRR